MTDNILKLQYCMSDLLCLYNVNVFHFFHKLCSDFDDGVPGAESSVLMWKVSRRLLFFFYECVFQKSYSASKLEIVPMWMTVRSWGEYAFECIICHGL